MKKAVSTLLTLSFVLLSACQTTPEDVAVVEKGDMGVYDAVQNGDYTAPARWEESFENGDGSIEFTMAADILVPAAQGYPVVRVSPMELTGEMAREIATGLVGDAPITMTQTDEERTKDEIMDRILQIKSGEGSDFYEIDPAGYLASIGPMVDFYERMYEKAPETYTPRPATWEFGLPPLTFDDLRFLETATPSEQESIATRQKSMQWIGIQADIGRDTPLYMTYLKQSLKRSGFSLWFGNERPAGIIRPLGSEPRGPSISGDEARNMAIEYIRNIGYASEYKIDFEGDILYKREDADPLVYREEDFLAAYDFVFTRHFGDIPMTFTLNTTGGSVTEQNQFIEGWDNEVIEVCITDEGIMCCFGGGFTTVGETINENVALLPFEQIQDRFIRHVKNAGIKDWNSMGMSPPVWEGYRITEVRLGMMRIMSGEGVDRYICVPVWDFFGYESIDYGAEASVDYTQYRESYLTINAVDGSIIDRSIGY